MKQKSFKRIFSIFLIMLLVMQMLPTSIVAEEIREDDGFTDLDSYEKEIYQLVELGIINGYPDKTFKPYHSITRAQGVAMIIREMKLDTSNRPDPKFKDINSKYRFYNEIATAVDEGIIDGFTDGTFGPNKEMTRSQMAKILVGAYKLKLQESKSISFKDVPAVHWAHDFINILASNGITEGYKDGTFNPSGNLNRLHFSLFLSRYINDVKDKKNDLAKEFELKADKTKVSYGESVSLTINNKTELNYKTDWKTSGGKLTVADSGKSATWKAEGNSTKDYKVTVTIEVTPKSGEKVTFDKSITISVTSTGGNSGGGGGGGSSTSADDDKDGLSNKKEKELGTDSSKKDTDGDGLTDGEEVNTHKTNPLKADTDEDGLSDSFEVGFKDSSKLDPLKADTDDNGTPDGLEDFDQDGLTNLLENELKTNITKKDSDEDGLLDGFEYDHGNLEELNPTLKDTNNNSINDGEEDFDQDHLINTQEQQYGTDPFSNDTDGDSLTDSEEINKYKTSPTKSDTDDDFLDDDSEIKFGTDPLNPDSNNNKVLDGHEKREQQLVSENLNATLALAATGDVEKTTTVFADNEVGDYVGTNGMIGSPIDIETSSEFDTAELTISYNPEELGEIDPNNLRIFYYNPETMALELVENQEVKLGSNQVTAELTHFSTYILADMSIWAQTWNTELIRGNENPNEERKPIELVFVIDSSGSMGSGPTDEYNKDLNNFRLSGTKLVIDALTETDRAAVVDFDSYSSIRKGLTYGTEEGKEELKNAVDKIDSYGGTNIAGGLGKAIGELKSFGSKDHTTNQIIILLTDGQNSYSSDDNRTREFAKQAKDIGIKVYTMGLGDSFNADLLREVAELTGGDFYHVNSAEDLHGRFLQAGDEVGLTKDSDNDTIPDWVEEKGYIIKDTLGKVIEPTNPNKEDSDGDGLLDRHELGDWYYNQETGKVYLARLVGDPNSSDTDNDGKTDENDIFPRIPKIVPVVFIHGINDNSRKVWGLETFVSNSDYEESKRKKITDDKGKSLYSINKGFTPGYFRAENQLVPYSDINTQYIYAYYKNNKIGKYLIEEKQYELNKELFVFNWENNHHIDVMAGELEGFLNGLSDHFKQNGQKENMDIFNEDNIAEFNLVGHSAGGMISRFYIENLMNDSDPVIKKLITLNTPHFGSGLASVGSNLPIIGGGAATAGCSNVLDDLRVTGSYLHTSDKDQIKGCKEKNNSYLKLDHPNTEYHFIGGFVVDPDGSNKGIEINPYLEKEVNISPLNETAVDVKHEELVYSKGILDEKISYGPTSAIIAAAGRYGDEVVSIYSQLGIPTDSQIKYSEDIKNDRWNGYTPLQNVHRHIYFGAHNVAEHNEITKEKEVQKLIIEILER